MKKYLLIATAFVALVSCSDDTFVGENSPNANENYGGAINFGSGLKAVTRTDYVGADAASMLNNHFTVGGFKGNGTTRTTVFDNYVVNWTENTAGKTTSNTNDWEYVGLDIAQPSSLYISDTTDPDYPAKQTIKYWDYSTSQYDFIAYSTGAKTATTGDPASGTSVQVTAIDPANLTTAAYTLKAASRADLAGCYVADMVTAYKADDPATYGKEVTLKFRSLASKVRIALYETVPGYSVKTVKFYSAHPTTLGSGSSEENAVLIGTMNDAGTYTVNFPTIGSSNTSDPDYNKAHVSFVSTSTSTSQAYGALTNQYTTKEYREKTGTKFLGRTSNAATFAGTGTFYQTVLPNETGVVFELAIDYTLESIDGSGEEINVYGATAYIPAVYTKWMPNYAYTYIFKISDNSNGWTSTTSTDPKGLYPITFDAVVVDSEEKTQSTITTVAEPSITTYQRGHVYNASNEYKVPTKPNDTKAGDNDAIYAQVMKDGALVTNLNTDGKSYFYKLTGNPGKTYNNEPADWPTGFYIDAACTTPATGTFSKTTTYYKSCTEADVMDALNIQESVSGSTITGRNGIILTPATADYTVTQIPGEDGNWITKYWNGSETANIAAGMVAKLTPAAGAYAFVYDYSSTDPAPSATDIYTAVQLTGASAPDDFTTKYYKKTGADTYTQCVAGDYVKDGYFYIKYQDRNHTYAVKVIKVE